MAIRSFKSEDTKDLFDLERVPRFASIERPALRKLRRRVDPRRYNGAVFLGLNGIVVKSHGGSDSLSFATAIGVAVDMAVNGFIDTIRGELERLQSAGQMEQPAAAVKA